MHSKDHTEDGNASRIQDLLAQLKVLFLAWQDPECRRWFTVGRLERQAGQYVYAYTNGVDKAKECGFTPLVSFPNFNDKYRSQEIFPLFANRVLPPNRPEYESFVEWLSIPKNEADPIAILARTGGEGDMLEIFPLPKRGEQVHFFVRGLRHQSNCAIERVKDLEVGEELLVMADLQNPHDTDALAVRTAEKTRQDMHILGYLPRYLAHELRQLEREELTSANITVERVNLPPAPIHFRILCRLDMEWPARYEPFSGTDYQPLQTVEES